MQTRFLDNFDNLRLAAASFVFIAHTFRLYGLPPVDLITGGDSVKAVTLGTLGVSMFFVISGYLVTSSWCRLQDTKKYIIHRILRIYPALLCNIFVTLFILIPLCSKGIGFYQTLYQHIGSVLYSAFLALEIPPLGKVFPGNAFPYSVNGSLWTLKYEILCYIAIGLIGSFWRINKLSLGLCTLLYIAVFYEKILYPADVLEQAYVHMLGFLIGAQLYLHKAVIPFNAIYAFLCLCILAGLMYFDLYNLGLYVLTLTYICIYAALHVRPIRSITVYGDYSYGIYIYAWPLQQIGAQMFPLSQYYLIVSISFIMIATVLFSVASWHFIERPILKLKSKLKG
ncbi:MAG: acyltransferase family protein [Alphaproteobacteria bacterium]